MKKIIFWLLIFSFMTLATNSEAASDKKFNIKFGSVDRKSGV